MATANDPIRVYLEVGDKKTFAVALDWPGWARSGRDEDSALQALYDYGPRYERALKWTPLGFKAPSDISAFEVVEKLPGTTTTDFGAPDAALPWDDDPVADEEVKRWRTVLKACWKAFDDAVEAAAGKTLRKGLRGGGRDLPKMIEHVRDVDKAYLGSLGGSVKIDKAAEPIVTLPAIRQAILDALAGRLSGDIPAEGARGGHRWAPRYFVRRLAWHELDHAWEIEDKAE